MRFQSHAIKNQLWTPDQGQRGVVWARGEHSDAAPNYGISDERKNLRRVQEDLMNRTRRTAPDVREHLILYDVIRQSISISVGTGSILRSWPVD